MTTKKLTVKECLSEFKHVSDQIKELNQYKTTLHEKLLQYMLENGRTELENDSLSAKLISINRPYVSKNDLPLDIWNQYKKNANYQFISVSDKTKSRRKKLDSASPSPKVTRSKKQK